MTRPNPFTDNSLQKEKAAQTPKKDYSKWFFILFGMVFAGVGGLVLILGIRDMVAAKSSETWVEIPCVIERSKVKSHSSDDGATYSILVRYSYKWKGKNFIGERYDFSSGSDSDYASKDSAVARYPVGKEAMCYVNPAQPDQAVLERSAGDGRWVLLVVGGVFFVVGVCIMCVGPLFREKTPATPDMRVPALLPVSSNPRRDFLFMCFAAVFWNSIVGGFVYAIVRTYLEDGTVEWFLVVFISIFVIAGMFFLIGAIRAFFGMFGPQLTLFMTPGVYPGEAVSVDWALAGDGYRVNALDMTLECVLRYRVEREMRNKKYSTTSEKVLRQMALLSEKGPLAVSRGTVTFVMPEDAEVSGTIREGILWRMKAEVRQSMKPTQKWVFKITVLDKEFR